MFHFDKDEKKSKSTQIEHLLINQVFRSIPLRLEITSCPMAVHQLPVSIDQNCVPAVIRWRACYWHSRLVVDAFCPSRECHTVHTGVPASQKCSSLTPVSTVTWPQVMTVYPTYANKPKKKACCIVRIVIVLSGFAHILVMTETTKSLLIECKNRRKKSCFTKHPVIDRINRLLGNVLLS